MARLYVCDRCQAKSVQWLEYVEIPSTTLFGSKINKELCHQCIAAFRSLFQKFMESK
jgi:hypothetical protein